MNSNFRALYGRYSNLYDANSSEKNSFEAWNPSRGVTGDAENANTTSILNRAWDLFRNNPTTRALSNTSSNGVIGTGLKVGPNIDYKTLGISKAEAKELNSELARMFNLWANDEMSCVDRKENFNLLQTRIFLNYWLSGGCFAVLRSNSNLSNGRYPFDLSVQGVDYAMVSNPIGILDTQKLMGGIEVNNYGEEVAYYFKKIDQSLINSFVFDTQRVKKYGKSGRRNVLHVHHTC